MSKHPMQKVYQDKDGTIRFRPNPLVQYMLDHGRVNLNDLAIVPASKADREQLAQLIGYSISGFGDLSYVRDKTFRKAMDRYEKVLSNTLDQKEETEK